MKALNKTSVYSIVTALTLFLVSLTVIAGGTLNVPITVKESSGSAAVNYPVTAMVPLPYGAYTSVSSFRLVNSSGIEVPAQFNPIMRNVFKDGSLRFVQIIFMATMSASQKQVFTLKDDAPAVSVSSPISVVETSNSVTVNTGKIEFRVLKTGFNLFDQVKLLSTGKILIGSSTNQGPLFTDQFDIAKFFSSRTIDKFTVEETGPIRSVIRVEGYSDTRDTINQKAGFIIRLYAYRNSQHVAVDMGLINGERTKWGNALYFNDFSVQLPVNLASPTVRVGLNSAVYTNASPSGGIKIQAHQVDNYTLTQSNNTLIQGGNARMCGWMDVKAATTGQGGVFTSYRNFWQTFPNALEFEASGKVRARLWPKGKHENIFWYNYNTYIDTTTLYWLDDMIGNRKELLYSFHDGSATNAELQALNRNFQWHPVASVPYSWHQQCATVDYSGALPNTVSVPTPTIDTVNYGALAGYSNPYVKGGDFRFGWYGFFGDVDRSGYSCQTGGVPYSFNQFLVNGSSYYYFENEVKAMGDVNTRRSWCPGWNDTYKTTGPMGAPGYCSGTLRSNTMGLSWNKPPKYAYGAHTLGWKARDYAHFWSYNLEDFYNVSGDPWIRDLMTFWLENFKSAGYNSIGANSLNSNSFTEQTRGIGHAFSMYNMAMRITNNISHFEHTKIWIDKLVQVQKFNRYGIFNPGGDKAYMISYLARSVVSYMNMIEQYNQEYWQKAFGLVYGMNEWNIYYGGFSDVWQPSDGTSKVYENIFGNGTNAVDFAAWFARNYSYYPARKSIDKAWHPASNSYVNVNIWGGSWQGREVVKYHEDCYLKKSTSDTLAPPAISAISTKLLSNKVRLIFATPDSAVKYHVRWSYKPLKEGPDPLNADTNVWWMSNGGGVFMTNKIGGQRDTLLLNITVPLDSCIYIAVKSFDANKNMSDISKNAKVCNNSLPTGIDNIFDTENQITISPNPSSGTIRLLNTQNENCRIVVYDVVGKVVYEDTDANPKNEIFMNEAYDGVYFLHYISKTGNSNQVIRFVKQSK